MAVMNPLLIQLFRDALDFAPSERSAYLDAQCTDPALRRQLDALLLAAEQTEPPLPAIQLPTTTARAIDQLDRSGEIVGAFRLLKSIGQGGMGAVWLAERVSGFSQQVAIKWLHAGLSRSARTRFARERETLAKLEHPGIARIVDGGSDGEAGWFAMEYVDGVTLDAYVNSTQANLNKRIGLIIALCDAVQYAHQNLIVHRDLKPGNILVNASGQPKLLDFGVAKILDDSDATESRAPMTYAYAAPEQIRGDTITTASDVYALGVILFELLTGQRPHKTKGDGSLSLLQAITDTDATAPSHVLSLRTNTETTIRPNQLRGDLDTIVLKALSRDPSRRYASVEAFAEDLKCYLAARPISARKDTPGYRLAKFVRRNRLAAAAFALALIALLGGSAAALMQMQRANAQAQFAQGENERNIALVTHLASVLNRARGAGETVPVAQLFDWVADANSSSANADGAAKLPLKLAICDLFVGMSDFPRLLKVSDSIGPELAAVSVHSRHEYYANRARALLRLGRFEDAKRAIDAAVALDMPPDASRPSVQILLGVYYRNQGDRVRASQAALDAVRMIQSVPNAAPQQVGGVLASAAVQLLDGLKLAQAQDLTEQALAIWAQGKVGTVTSVLSAKTTLANIALARGALVHAQAQFAALEQYSDAQAVAPKSSRRAAHAKVLALLGQYPQAITAVRSARDDICKLTSATSAECLSVQLALVDVALIGNDVALADQTLKLVEAAEVLPPAQTGGAPTATLGVALTNTALQLRLRTDVLQAPSAAHVDAYLSGAASQTQSGWPLLDMQRWLLLSAQQLHESKHDAFAAQLAQQALKLRRGLPEQSGGEQVGGEQMDGEQTGGMDDCLARIWQARINQGPITAAMRAELAQAIGANHPWVLGL
jgi:eukaryotic-like serine/threonine-protein kinase